MPDRNLEKLLSGYSTHTLTQEERKALFEAALRDQVLFNAMADEQALKELLDDPHSRRQLLEALEGMDRAARKPWFVQVQACFQRPFGWAVAGSLAVAVIAVLLVFRMSGPLPPKPYLTADSRSISEPQTRRAPDSTSVPSKKPSAPIEEKPVTEELKKNHLSRKSLSRIHPLTQGLRASCQYLLPLQP